MSLLADLKKTHVLAWSEDDAMPRAPDHEGPVGAMKRLGRSWEDAMALRGTGLHEGFDVHVDAEAFELGDGDILILS